MLALFVFITIRIILTFFLYQGLGSGIAPWRGHPPTAMTTCAGDDYNHVEARNFACSTIFISATVVAAAAVGAGLLYVVEGLAYKAFGVSFEHFCNGCRIASAVPPS